MKWLFGREERRSECEYYFATAGAITFAWAVGVLVMSALTSIVLESDAHLEVTLAVALMPVPVLVFVYPFRDARKKTRALSLCFARDLLDASARYRHDYGDLTVEASMHRREGAVPYLQRDYSAKICAFIALVREQGILLRDVVPTTRVMHTYFYVKDSDADPRLDVLRMLIIHLELTGVQVDKRPVYYLAAPVDRDAHQKAKQELEGIYLSSKPRTPPSPIASSTRMGSGDEDDDHEATIYRSTLTKQEGLTNSPTELDPKPESVSDDRGSADAHGFVIRDEEKYSGPSCIGRPN